MPGIGPSSWQPSLPPQDDDELTPERRDELINWLLEKIDRWKLYTPAILLVEGMRPLHYIGAQMAFFGAPYLSILGAGELGNEVGRLLSDPKNLDLFLQRLEERARAQAEEEEHQRLPRQRPWWRRRKGEDQ